VLGVASLLDADRDTNGRSTPETTSSAPAGDAGENGTDTPGNPPMTGIPQDKYVRIDESVFMDRPADFAVAKLEDDGLAPVVLNQNGRTPLDLSRCTVYQVAPNGRQPMGTEVTVRCEEDEEPPR